MSDHGARARATFPCPECGEPIILPHLRCQTCICRQRDVAYNERDEARRELASVTQERDSARTKLAMLSEELRAELDALAALPAPLGLAEREPTATAPPAAASPPDPPRAPYPPRRPPG